MNMTPEALAELDAVMAKATVGPGFDDVLADMLRNAYPSLRAHIATVEAERERLREALNVLHTAFGCYAENDMQREAVAIARAALTAAALRAIAGGLTDD